MKAVRFAAFVALCMVVSSISADDKKMDMKAMEAEMMKHATPGESHKVFETFAGKWEYTGKMWMDPKADPMPLKGKCESTIIMGGRFMMDDMHSTDAQNPWDGRGIWGFDNHKQKFVYSWVDSWSTSIMNGEGTWDKSKNTMTAVGECYCPMTKGNMKMRDVAVVKPNGTVHREFFSNMGGQEMKVMELDFTRVK